MADTEEFVGSEPVVFTKEVEAAIAQVLPSDDPLDQADFNVVDYINTIFPTEQSLSTIDDSVSKLRLRIRRLNAEIRSIVHRQTNSGDEGRKALQDAQAAIHDLFARINEIKDKANTSEQMVQEITRDIKQLDYAKRNLTASITTLNHLHMLVGGIDSLKHLIHRRNYREASNVLDASLNVLAQFDKHKGGRRISELTREMDYLKGELRKNVEKDFDEGLNQKGLPLVSNAIPQLHAAFECARVIGDGFEEKLIQRFIKKRLHDYPVLFDNDLEPAELAKVDRRYSWFRRNIAEFDKECEGLFPQSWQIDKQIALEFCKQTKSGLVAQFAKNHDTLTIELLIHVLGKTHAFEEFLMSRFIEKEIEGSEEVSAENDTHEFRSDEPLSEADQIRMKYAKFREERKAEESSGGSGGGGAVRKMRRRAESPFKGIISQCCGPYMGVYVEGKAEALENLFSTFTTSFSRDDGRVSKVLPSCADLFYFYKNSLVQCASLSTKEPLFQLSTRVFARFLTEYGQRALLGVLPQSSSSSAADKSSGNASVVLSSESIRLICGILNTAEYCQDTTRQLEGKIKEKIDPEFEERVSFADQIDLFAEIMSTCVQTLVRGLNQSVENAFTVMHKTHWNQIDSVGDQSSYVNDLQETLSRHIPVVRDHFTSAKYFTQTTLKFASSFLPKLLQTVFMCKPMNAIGAEQLLLDVHSIKTLLLKLPNVNAQLASKISTAYRRVVENGINKIEMILKIVLTSHEPAESCVLMYVSLMGSDANDSTTFGRILEMKGLGRREKQALMEEFARQTTVPAEANEKSSGSSIASSVSGALGSVLRGSKSSAVAPTTTTTTTTSSSSASGAVGAGASGAQGKSYLTGLKIEKLINRLT